MKYAVVTIVFGTGFALIEEVFTYRRAGLHMIVTAFTNMLSGNSWEHMWYMYALLGATLFIPVLRAITAAFDRQQIRYFLLVSFLFMSILPTVTAITGFRLGVSFPLTSIYCLFMLLGYWIDSQTIRLSENACRVIILSGAVLFIALSVMQQVWGIRTTALNVYSSPIVIVFSAALFSYARSMEGKLSEYPVPAVIKWLESVSFGVYLVHMFWINIIYKLLKFNPFAFLPVLSFLLMWISVVLLSVLTVVVIRKIPCIKRFV